LFETSLKPVRQVIYVVDADYTTQIISSITTLASDDVAVNPVPVIVTKVDPPVVPNRGETLVTNGVLASLYYTILVKTGL
jgi:hypothetical protein